MKKSQAYLLFCLLVWAIFNSPIVYAKTVRSDCDLKFYEITSYNEPAQYLGFTSSKLDNFVEVPLGDKWYVRPDGSLREEGYVALVEELKKRKFPGLDLSDRWDVKNQTIANLDEIESLRVLKLSNTKITPAGLAIVQKLPKLKVLSLNNQTTDAGLRSVKGLQKLESLDLQRSKITDAGVSVLGTLPKLEALDVSNTKLTDVGAKILAQIPSLKQLDVSGTQVTDKGIGFLAALPKLETLYASGHLSSGGLKALAQLKHLKNLDVSGTRITDEGLSVLVGLKVEALALSGTSIGDDGLQYVAQMKSLKILELSDTKMTPDGLYILGELPHLETVSVSWNELTDPELQALGHLTHLQKVILNGRTLPPQTLNRIRSMAKLIKPKQQPRTVVVQQPILKGVAPAAHPAVAPQAKAPLLESRSLAKPRIATDRTHAGIRSVTLPPDITPASPVRSTIGSEGEPKGKGMEIEVGVGSAQPGGKAHSVTGLKRIYQAELLQRSHDGDVAPGQSKEITFQQDKPENSLGEINVNSK